MNSTSMQWEIAWGKFFFAIKKKEKEKEKGMLKFIAQQLPLSYLRRTGSEYKNLTSCISVVVSFRGVESFFSQSSM